MVSDHSLAQVEFFKRMNTDQLARLKTVDRGKLTGMDAVNYDVVLYGLQQQEVDNKRFQYGGGGVGSPYVISQLTGSYSQAPDFLDSQHSIETKDDADAYLARLSAFSTVLDEEREVAEHDVAMGVTPPDFVLARALEQMTHLRGVEASKSVMVESVARRAKEKNIAGDYAHTATRLLEQRVYPALDRQIAVPEEPAAQGRARRRRLAPARRRRLLRRLARSRDHDQPEARRDSISSASTWSRTTPPGSDAIMQANGMTKGTVGERLRAMYDDPKFRYENTDAGKDKLIADLNVKVQAIRAKLPGYFGALPKADLLIKRVPKYTEAGAPGGYYQNASLDGSRPGTYYINLRDTAEVPSWTLPTLTYHEAFPAIICRSRSARNRPCR